MSFIWFCLGCLLGSIGSIIVMCILVMGKLDELHTVYRRGYDKGYREGVAYGYLKARKEVANLFQKHLKFSKISDKPNKNQDKALAKFEDFLNVEEK